MANTPKRGFPQFVDGATGWGVATDAFIAQTDNALFDADTYSAGVTYKQGDVVLHANGATYRALQPGTGNDPATTPLFWRAFTVTPTLIGAVGTGDSRLSDARTPLAHAASHVGGDPIQSATDSIPGLMSPSDHTTLTANTTKLSTLPSSVTGTTPVVVNGSGVVSMAAATDSVNGYLAAVDHATYTTNTTKLAGLPTSITGTAPIAVVSGTVSIQNATDAQAGAMTAVDHTTLTANTTKLATLPSSVTGTAPIAVNGSGVVSIATATDSVPGAMSAADHTQLTTNTTKLSTLPSSVTGTAPITVSGGGAVSIATATDSVPGAMSAADHTSLTADTAAIAAATSAATVSTIVKRDGAGAIAVVGVTNTGAGSVTGTLTASGAVALGAQYGTGRAEEIGQSNGHISVDGDAKSPMFVFRGQTANATLTELFYGVGNLRLTLATARRFGFTMQATTVNTSDASLGGSWSAVGECYRKTANTIVLIGGSVQPLLGTTPTTGLAVALSQDTTNNALGVKVTGIAAATYDWNVTIQLTEVA